MKIDELNNNHITAEEGKVFRRISDWKNRFWNSRNTMKR